MPSRCFCHHCKLNYYQPLHLVLLPGKYFPYENHLPVSTKVRHPKGWFFPLQMLEFQFN